MLVFTLMSEDMKSKTTLWREKKRLDLEWVAKEKERYEKDKERRREYMRGYQQKNKEKANEANRRWRAKNPEKSREYFRLKARERYKLKNEECRAYGREYYYRTGKSKRTPERRFKEALKRNYGLTVEQYNQMVSDTGGKCPICTDELVQGRIHVDHCHTTGRVRGILCGNCNSAEGFLRTSENAHRMYQYMLANEKT